MQGKTWKQTCPDSLQQGALSCKTYRCRKQPVELLGFSLSRSPALQKKTALFLIKTCRPPRQKRWFISVPYCPYYSTLVTVLQDFFIGFFRSLSRKYSWKSKKFDNFVQEIQKFLLISHGNRRFPNNSRFYPSLLFFQNSPLILEIRMRIYRILLVPETIPCYNKKSICGDNKPTLLFYVLAFYPFSLMPAVFSALPVGKVWRKQQLQMHQKQSIINIISGINDAGAASPAGNSRTAILGFIFSCIEERRKNLWRKNNSRKKRN